LARLVLPLQQRRLLYVLATSVAGIHPVASRVGRNKRESRQWFW